MSFWYLQLSQKQTKNSITTMLLQTEMFSFVFWENWRHQKDISKLTAFSSILLLSIEKISIKCTRSINTIWETRSYQKLHLNPASLYFKSLEPEFPVIFLKNSWLYSLKAELPQKSYIVYDWYGLKELTKKPALSKSLGHTIAALR